jgi:cytochrome c biogenesis protein CcmG/thiol:disulfide interchange protein DsbE
LRHDENSDSPRKSWEALSLKRWVRVAVAGVTAGGVIGLLAYGFTRDARYIQSPLVARQAPSFTLTLFDGSTVSLRDLRGKAVFLNFWASWCPPCRAEARALEAAWQKNKGPAVVFLGIDIQDKEEDARAFLEEFGVTYMNGPDAGGRIAIDYGVWGIPESYFIDPEGRITYKHVGGIGASTVEAKLVDALKGVVSAEEGKGEYRSVH